MLKSILLVEDHPRDLELTLIALKQCNLDEDVAVTRDGVEALDYLFRRNEFAARISGNPSLVILDLKTPRVGGIQVLETIRASEELRSIPVVVLTNSRESSDLEQAYALGVNSYVVKPMKFSKFIAAVSDLGVFWAELNVPPPGSTPLSLRRDHAKVRR